MPLPIPHDPITGLPHNAKLTEKICPECKYKFKARNRNAIYCTQTCKQRAYERRDETWKLLQIFNLKEGGGQITNETFAGQVIISKFWDKEFQQWFKKNLGYRYTAEYRQKQYCCWFIPKGKHRSMRLYIKRTDE